jgi:serine/threonine-protein kinase
MLPNDAPIDPDLFPVLDAYLRAMHEGQRAEQERLVAAHPGLREMFACLNDLESLAPLAPPRNDSEAVTIPPVAPPQQTLTAGIPSDFGKYELLGEIGRGGMGVVFQARQKDLDRLVAIKMILGSQLASEDLIQRFHAEARAAAKIQHPHIVQVYETGTLNGLHYFAMQYVEGNSLEHWIREQRMKQDEGVRILADIARAVEVLHQHGIIHRDLKPSNILVDAAGHAFLSDFGLAKSLEEANTKTVTGAVIGTPSYMAPEQAAGSKQVGPLSDVYSLGAILYEMLTGRPPFREETPLDTLVQVVEGEPTLPHHLNLRIPLALEWICLKCLEKDPVNRYRSAAALADDLDRYLHGETVEARPQNAGQRLLRWSRREPGLAARLGGLAVVTTIIQVNYHLTGEDRGLHLQVLGLLGLWALVTVACRLLLAGRRAEFIPCLWMASDVLLLAALLHIAESFWTPLVAGLPLLIVVSGLFFRVSLVWYTTILTMVTYAPLCWRFRPPPPFHNDSHYHVLYLVMLGVFGILVSYQVHRVRVLSRYYGHRPLP